MHPYPYDLNDPADLEAAMSYPDVIPPCPPWCVLPAGHGYEGTVYGEPTVHERSHSSRDWDTHRGVRNGAEVVQYETNQAGAVALFPPIIKVTVGGDPGGEVTAGRQDASLGWAASEASALAMDLSAAAHLLRRLPAAAL